MKGTAEKTVMLVGKGITYDTGGADIKAGGIYDLTFSPFHHFDTYCRKEFKLSLYDSLPGIMAGMSRDKCGAADVAGFMKIVSLLKPKNVKVVCAMAMVRNSVGSNCYVSDEIITSRAGVRLRVGNTDAEVVFKQKPFFKKRFFIHSFHENLY